MQSKSQYDRRIDLNRLHKSIFKEREVGHLGRGEGKTTIATHELYGYLELGLRVVCIFENERDIRNHKSNIFVGKLDTYRNLVAIRRGDSPRVVRGRRFDVYVDFTHNRDLLTSPTTHIWFNEVVLPVLV